MSLRYQPLNARHAASIAAHAARLRAEPTPSERLLWAQLAGSKLGVPFRRQCRIGRFIADFAAPSCRLVIEVDGGYHAQRASADASRDAKLQRLGWQVLHIPADTVLRNLPAAIAAVRAALADPSC